MRTTVLQVFIHKLVRAEVRTQLNILLYGRKAGLRRKIESNQPGLTTVRRKADKPKRMGELRALPNYSKQAS
jgi:hypothetical protein